MYIIKTRYITSIFVKSDTPFYGIPQFMTTILFLKKVFNGIFKQLRNRRSNRFSAFILTVNFQKRKRHCSVLGSSPGIVSHCATDKEAFRRLVHCNWPHCGSDTTNILQYMLGSSRAKMSAQQAFCKPLGTVIFFFHFNIFRQNNNWGYTF